MLAAHGQQPFAPTVPTTRMSKSKFLAGLQCPKRLYLEIHAPFLATRPDGAMQAILDLGHEVGEVARTRFPGGVLVEADHRHPLEALQRTQALIDDPGVPAIFEAAFIFDDVLVRVDILERAVSPGGAAAWRLIEVKSSARVKEVHLDDLALQWYVLTGCGLEMDSACLMHVNTQYLYPGGEIDLHQLFSLHDLTPAVAARQAKVSAHLGDMKRTVESPLPPNVEPGRHCHAPHQCRFWEHCTRAKPARWIFHLPGGNGVFQALVAMGVQTIDDIPASFTLSPGQRRMKENVEWLGPGLKAALEGIRYPVHHLDFESFMPAVPKFPMTRPYQAIPTQWSNHVELPDGEIRHDEYLCPDSRDPREELALALLASLGGEGSICVYSGYERAILERLAEALPGLRAPLLALMPRLWDLFEVIHDHYYHPAFQGSYSIKAVLPAVAPALGYTDLRIQEGGTAAREYARMVFDEMDLIERLNVREALAQYCARDTLAMLELRRILAGKAGGSYAGSVEHTVNDGRSV
jgi:hypothetical protein